MAIPEYYVENFKTLLRAAKDGHLALLECRDKQHSHPVYAIVAVAFDGHEYTMTPVGKMFDGDPYEEVDPPVPGADVE